MLSNRTQFPGTPDGTPANALGLALTRAQLSLPPGLRLPPGVNLVELLGVTYAHLKLKNGSDLYLTEFGLPFWEHLLPKNWHAKEWFEAKRERLIGTSVIYRVPTKTLRNISLHLVVKWSRVGEEVPLDTMTINKFIHAEFNSPFEEFSLVMELRGNQFGPAKSRILTQKPLAIYVPSERLRQWQTGRSAAKIAAKIAQHPGVELDMLRQYVLIYGWIKGSDAQETAAESKLSEPARADFLGQTTQKAITDLHDKGYRVIDMKPAHIILRPDPNGALLRDRNGRMAYAVVDYELLERTPEHEQVVRRQRRQFYFEHMLQRFTTNPAGPLPAHLKRSHVLGVDYIFGHAESTGGLLWVIGQDPDLFNYFLPERWRRTPSVKLRPDRLIFSTHTKDNVILVWKVSRLGEQPAAGEPAALPDAIANASINSPFEEFAYALEMSRAGVKTVYPRAIYMTGRKVDVTGENCDDRHYAALKDLRTPDGEPAVRKDHDYITIWGFWTGPDELLAMQHEPVYRGINLDEALNSQIISPETRDLLIAQAHKNLARIGLENPFLSSDQLLLSLTSDQKLVRDLHGLPEVRFCNFELIRRLNNANP
jgi:hypothetical protein